MKPFVLMSIHGIHRNFSDWASSVVALQNLTWSVEIESTLRFMHAVFFSGLVYVNDTYLVLHHDKDGPTERLTIYRHDFAPCNSWSDFQQIKNRLIGLEVEAVQVYPAESRLLDTDNVYHLFVVREKLGFNFGRAVWRNEKVEPPPHCENCED